MFLYVRHSTPESFGCLRILENGLLTEVPRIAQHELAIDVVYRTVATAQLRESSADFLAFVVLFVVVVVVTYLAHALT